VSGFSNKKEMNYSMSGAVDDKESKNHNVRDYFDNKISLRRSLENQIHYK
jgi:hypothetical protein